MTRESITPQKYKVVSEGRRKFKVKILVMKKNNSKDKQQTKERATSQKAQNPLYRLKQEIEQNRRHVYQNKTKIEKLTDSAIEELMKIHKLNIKAKVYEEKLESTKKRGRSESIKKISSSKNDHNGFGIEYELANMKMIRKILNLAVPFEEKQYSPKKDKNAFPRPSGKKAKAKSLKKGKEPGSSAKILIVEDDRTTIKIISHLLEQHDFKVLSATDAEEGLIMTFKELPDLVLLDIMLPGMDGFQFLAKLRANQQTSRMPVIILSSLSGEKDVLKGLERGASDYILKPFSPQILFFKIKKILAFQNEHITYSRNL